MDENFPRYRRQSEHLTFTHFFYITYKNVLMKSSRENSLNIVTPTFSNRKENKFLITVHKLNEIPYQPSICFFND